MAKITIKITKMDKTETITMKEYLIQKGITFKETNGELITKCVFCEKENHLYFSAETGQYQCKVCGEEGNIFTLAKHFGDDLRNIITNYHYNNMENNKSPFDITLVEEYHNALPQEIRAYLNNRGISDEIIEKNKLGWGNFYGRDWITIPIKDFSGSYTFLKLRRNPFKEDENDAKYMFYPKGNSAVLYGAERLKSNDKVIVCEGEFDQMILEKHGIAAVTSTAGAGTFKREWLDYFHGCQEIHICFDLDEAGKKGAKRVAQGLSAVNDAKIYIASLPQELGGGGDITDYFVKGYKIDDLFLQYSELQTFDTQNGIMARQNLEVAKPSRAMKLVGILESMNLELFLDQYNEPYAAVNGDGGNIMKIDSRDFDIWIQGESYGRGETFGSEIAKNAKMILSAKARKEGKRHDLNVRVSWDEEGNLWYDMGKKAVRINAEGWETIDRPPILFRRFKHQQEQIEPKQGNSLDRVFDFINVKNKEDRILLRTYIVSCFIPGFPHPILTLFGEYGSAKSTTFKIVKSLIDPSSLHTLSPIKNANDFIQTVSHHWVSCFDNLSGLTNDLSDQICRVCTGEGLSKRKLYCDDDDVIYSFQHVICINGIANVINNGDLLNRSLLIEMARISNSERKSENDMNKKFAELKPEILGSCFDTLSKAMRIKPTVELAELPRMADFAGWGCAIAEALEIGKESFLLAYKNNIIKQNEEAINASPIGSAIIELIDRESSGIIREQPTAVLRDLKGIAESMGLETSYSKYWPKDARHLWRKLSEIAPDLKARGIEISKGRGNDRYIEIKNTEKYEAHRKELAECAEIAPKIF